MGTKKQDEEILKRVENEARGGGNSLRNSAMICRNCIFRLDDSEKRGNATVCTMYPDGKPNEIVFNGSNDCGYYMA